MKPITIEMIRQTVREIRDAPYKDPCQHADQSNAKGWSRCEACLGFFYAE